MECCPSVCQPPGLLGDQGHLRLCWTLVPVYLPFECRKFRLSLCQWSHCLRFNLPELPPPLISTILMRYFLSEHSQYHPVVCVHLFLPNPCIEKVMSVHSNNLVPPPRHLSVLLPHPPCPAPVSSVSPPCHEVVYHVLQSEVCHHRHKFFLLHIERL